MNNTDLIKQAQQAMHNAYAPYSKFKVGAALLAQNGTVYTGCNVENCSYGATICAERVAITKAVSEGVRDFKAIAIVSSCGDFTLPCGICRQVMAEFSPDIGIIVTNGTEITVYPLADLLPHAFKSASLG